MDAYAKLVADRKTCPLCGERMTNPNTIPGSNFDSDEIGPWSLWLGDHNARIMIVGKDWRTVDYFEKNKGKDDPKNKTNKRLIELIKLLGIEVSDCSQGQNTTSGIFLTNAVLCLKNANTSRAKKAKSMSAYVPKACFNNCQSLLLRTIETVNAKYIISLGEDAFKAVLAAHKQPLLPYKGPYKIVVERRSEIQLGERYLFPVCHTSCESANRPPYPHAMNADWIAIRQRIEAIDAAQTL